MRRLFDQFLKPISLRRYLAGLLMFLVVMTVCSYLPAFAQDASAPAPAAPTDISPWAPLIGAGITIAVAALKNVSFFKDHPKWVALGISLLVTAAQAFAGAKPSNGVLAFALNVITQLASAVGTHEVVVKSLSSGDSSS